jgi:Ca2+-binding EF-hand superfamily protein
METLSREQQKEFKEAFSLFEKEDGTITVKDLLVVIRSLGLNPFEEELMRELAIIDKDTAAYRSVEYNEFIKIITRRIRDNVNEDAIRETFNVFDKDGNGSISAEEFKRVLTTMGEKVDEIAVDKLLEEVTVDEQGFISLDSVIKAMTTL